MRAYKRTFCRPALVTLAAILVSGCDNSSDPGSITTATRALIEVKIWTTTPNSGVDADGYTLIVDDGPPRAIPINTTVTLDSLARGRHRITLGGLASNCSVSDTNERFVDVGPRLLSLAVSFNVTCIGDPNGAGDWDY